MNKSPETLVKEADDLIKAIWGYLDDPENLSKGILQLSILNAGLGNHLAESMRDAAETKNELQFQRETIKLDHMKNGDTATKADSEKIVQTKELSYSLIVQERLVTLLKLKRDDIDRVFDGGRSRLAIIKQDMKQI